MSPDGRWRCQTAFGPDRLSAVQLSKGVWVVARQFDASSSVSANYGDITGRLGSTAGDKVKVVCI